LPVALELEDQNIVQDRPQRAKEQAPAVRVHNQAAPGQRFLQPGQCQRGSDFDRRTGFQALQQSFPNPLDKLRNQA